MTSFVLNGVPVRCSEDHPHLLSADRKSVV